MVFCDTEEEFDWSKPQNRDNRSTTHMKAMPAADRRLRDLGAHSIYLVDHPIATDPASIDILGPLQEAGACGIGTQLHPWVNPPFEEQVNRTNSFAGNLPPALERAKLTNLTETIERSFGRRPVMYRAGRYGVGANTAGILSDLGYEVDVSVRARFDYSDEKGPNFSAVKPIPYRIGGGSMLEVPLSSAYLGALHGLGPSFLPADRQGSDPARRARPVGAAQPGLADARGVPAPGGALPALERLLDDGRQIISISYHSPSIEPGHTPFVKTQSDLDVFYAWWEGILGLLARRGATAATIDDVVEAGRNATPLHA